MEPVSIVAVCVNCQCGVPFIRWSGRIPEGWSNPELCPGCLQKAVFRRQWEELWKGNPPGPVIILDNGMTFKTITDQA